MTKKQAKSDPSDGIPLSKQASDIAQNGLAGMGECIEAIREEIRGGDRDRGAELALLTHKSAQIMGEARKRENDEAKLELTDAVLVEYFRRMAPDKRAQWCKDIAAMDRRGSVLG